MSDYRSLRAWQEAHALTLEIYRATRSFPPSELYGLTSQMRRASSSIPANLAEGSGRGSDADFVRFVRIAIGSASELEYHLLLARDLELLGPDIHQQLNARTRRVRAMLAKLVGSVLRKLEGGSTGDRQPATGDPSHRR